MRESLIDKKTDQNEAEQLKQIYNYYFDERSEIMINTQFKVKVIFDDVLGKDSISTEQKTKLNNFLAKMM